MNVYFAKDVNISDLVYNIYIKDLQLAKSDKGLTKLNINKILRNFFFVEVLFIL